MEAKPYFYFNPADWDIKIDKVDYYVDDVFIQTETKSPYAIEYKSNDWYIGAHHVKANITISGKNIYTFILQATKVIDNSSSQEKAADIWFDYNYATTGEEFFITANINYNRTSPGTSITSYSAKWDEESMGERTAAPYKLTHVVKDEPGTKHSVYATINYTQDKAKMNYSYSMSTYEIPGPKSVMQTFVLKSRYADYKNGDMLEGIARQFIGSEVKSRYVFELYLDNVLIGEAKTFPCDISYKLEKLVLGEHTLKKQWVCFDEEGKRTSSYSTNETITITQ